MIDGDTPWRLAVVDSLVRLVPSERRGVDPPTRWDTIAGNVVRYPDTIGVACGCPPTGDATRA